MVFIKDVSGNADAGTAQKWGGNDINFLDDYFDDVDITPKVGKINTRTYFRSGKFEWRNPANTFSYIIIASAIAANRNITVPLMTADGNMVIDSFPNIFTTGQTITRTSAAEFLTLNKEDKSVGTGADLSYKFWNSTDTPEFYARLRAEIVDNTAGAVDGRLKLRVAINSVETDVLTADGVLITSFKPIQNESYIDLKAIAEPSSPASGYIRMFIDSGDGKTKIKRSNGDVVIIE